MSANPDDEARALTRIGLAKEFGADEQERILDLVGNPTTTDTARAAALRQAAAIALASPVLTGVRATVADQVGNADLKRGGVSWMSGREPRPIAVRGENADQAGSDDGSVRVRTRFRMTVRAGPLSGGVVDFSLRHVDRIRCPDLDRVNPGVLRVVACQWGGWATGAGLWISSTATWMRSPLAGLSRMTRQGTTDFGDRPRTTNSLPRNQM
jgi:hypothetical protein